jgi:hypothetical protein
MSKPVTDHPFTPKYEGIDEWKQLCIHVDAAGEACGRSKPNHASRGRKPA